LAEITADLVKELRQRTGVGLMDCKRALAETSGDVELAIDHLRKTGAARASKKAGRETSEGLVSAYIHPGGRVGVLIEVNCETDFVARTDEFQELVRNIAMHVAASSPLVIRREELSTDLIDKESAIVSEQLRNEGKPDEMIERIIVGKMEKFYRETVLLEQTYVRDDKKTIDLVVKEAITKLGENIVIRRASRFALGQE